MNVIVAFMLLRTAWGEQRLICETAPGIAVLVAGPQHAAELGDYGRQESSRCCNDDTDS